MNTTQVAIYARVSSEQQAETHTMASQVAAVRERVATDGLAVSEAMQFLDEGYSGATLVRPALERLRDVVASGSVDRLLCTRRIAWPANMRIKCCWSMSSAALASRLYSLTGPWAEPGRRPAAASARDDCRVRAGQDYRASSAWQAPCGPCRGGERAQRRPLWVP